MRLYIKKFPGTGYVMGPLLKGEGRVGRRKRKGGGRRKEGRKRGKGKYRKGGARMGVGGQGRKGGGKGIKIVGYKRS